MNVLNGGRSILLEDVEGWVLGFGFGIGIGFGFGVVNENKVIDIWYF